MEEFNNVLREGNVVKGKVVKKTEDQIYVDVGYKKEGIILKDEVLKYNYLQTVQLGDEIEVFVKRLDKNTDNNSTTNSNQDIPEVEISDDEIPF